MKKTYIRPNIIAVAISQPIMTAASSITIGIDGTEDVGTANARENYFLDFQKIGN